MTRLSPAVRERRNRTFGRVLRAARLGSALSLRQIARAINVSVTYLSDVERGERPPLSWERIATVARVLGADERVLTNAALPGGQCPTCGQRRT